MSTCHRVELLEQALRSVDRWVRAYWSPCLAKGECLLIIKDALITGSGTAPSENVSTQDKPRPDISKTHDIPLVVTRGGVPFPDQAEGLRQFKEACLAPPKPFFPGTASMHANQHKLAVTTEWMRGWNACLDEVDRHGGFTRAKS